MHLAWVSDPSTTLTVVWRTLNTSTPSEVEYRRCRCHDVATATGGPTRRRGRPARSTRSRSPALTPSTPYEYRVRGRRRSLERRLHHPHRPAAGRPTSTPSTSPTPGLIGRADGLADRHAAGDQRDRSARTRSSFCPAATTPTTTPTSASARSTTRSTPGSTRCSRSPPRSPLMPTYGNHEVAARRGLRRTGPPVSRRRPGFDGRRVLLVRRRRRPLHLDLARSTDTDGPAQRRALSGSSTTSAPRRTPGSAGSSRYFHVSAVRRRHEPSRRTSRCARQLGPLFERHGVKLVLVVPRPGLRADLPADRRPGDRTRPPRPR